MPKRVALIGLGAIASALAQALRGHASTALGQVVVRQPRDAALQARAAALAPGLRLVSQLEWDAPDAPQLVVECAGHGAVQVHLLPALRRGVPAVMASVGALHDAALLAQVADAAGAGGTQVQLVAGAVGGIDALAAARLGGLDQVQYTGRKPPQGWHGTPAEQVCDLATLREAATVFSGSAREAARLYPKNANVAATVSLAGLGLDATQATLVADPAVTRNVHRIVASGTFGRLDLHFENEPLAGNPKTSALTVLSLARAVRNATEEIVL